MDVLHSSDSTSAEWLRGLGESDGIRENCHHFWGDEPSVLCTSAAVEDFTAGTGESIFTEAIIPLILSAEEEVIFVTCFWATSPSQAKLSSALVELSQRVIAQGLSKIRVRLCFSSRSLWQKLFHTTSAKGEIYPPSKWVSKLGLPAPDQLQGLDLQIKSLFFLPFSVLHPKFVVVDRRVALLPSCNVSWETWLECHLKVSGPVIGKLLDFWKETWETGDFSAVGNFHTDSTNPTSLGRSTLLPSQHHQNPRFRLLALRAPPPPPTPLNLYLLDAISRAKLSIDIITPNLTCAHVISALLSALSRGVDVYIMTCRRMMVIEQLATAGTITELSVWRLVRRYKKMLRMRSATSLQKHWSKSPQRMPDVEQGRQGMGSLRIGYFTPRSERPEVKCHIKCTIIDNTTAILGSGNMDRASWFTSQELGIALEEGDVVTRVVHRLHQAKKHAFVDWYEV